ncbi:MAG: ubiquinol-cytochrome C chaperone [Alphaproteobacteria bacterium]|nr:ubiquinol-cytochrome C chaperone [Alphaproteobacteria bacterium]
MFAWLYGRNNPRRIAGRLYEAIVTQARNPAFYSDHGVPDTLEGRYEMVVAHLVLVIERLRAQGDTSELLSRALVERFVTDMDDSMRELGVGDTSVAKKVKGAAAGLVERTAAYRKELKAGPEHLAAEIRRNIEGNVEAPAANPAAIPPRDADLIIARYLYRSAEALARRPIQDILSGKPLFEPIQLTLTR